LVAAGLALVAAGIFAFVRYGRKDPVPIDDSKTNPPSVPVPKVPFTDVTSAAGIRFQHFNGAAGAKLLPETMGSGVAVLDFDRDGKPDLLFINSRSWPGHTAPIGGSKLALYRNKGDGTFEDATEDTGLGLTIFGMGVAIGDIDNDTFPDIFITAVGGNYLFHNVAGGKHKRRFEDISRTSRIEVAPDWPDVNAEAFPRWQGLMSFPASATFLDYDGDGKLDLFICNYVTWSPAKDLSINAQIPGVGRAYVPPQQFEAAHCRLFRNIDGLHFEDVSERTGIQVFDTSGGGRRKVGKALGVVICDPDEDGWPDIVVANDTERNFFFHNIQAADGSRSFEEIGLPINIAYSEGHTRGAMGIDWGEYQLGKEALLIANFANEPDSFLTLVDPKYIRFVDAASTVGLAEPSRLPLKFGAFFFDYDLDGRMDLLTCNGHLEPEINKAQSRQTYKQPVQLYWNTGAKVRVFEPVTAIQSGEDLFRPMVGRGCAYLDYDGDGDLDVVLTENNGPARLLRNDQNLGNHWVHLRLVGDGVRSSRNAIGAVVTIETGGVIQRRYHAGARGYLSQCDETITFGLGSAETIDRITVRWPGKAAVEPQEWKRIPANRSYELHQGNP
jgi:hypothetical protein